MPSYTGYRTGGRRLGVTALQPVEVWVAGLLVLVFLLVESSPEGAGWVVWRCRGSVAIGDRGWTIVIGGVAAAVTRLLVLQTILSNISGLDSFPHLIFLLVIAERSVTSADCGGGSVVRHRGSVVRDRSSVAVVCWLVTLNILSVSRPVRLEIWETNLYWGSVAVNWAGVTY